MGLEMRWCGKCEDHPAHTWCPYSTTLLCLGGWDGHKVKI